MTERDRPLRDDSTLDPTDPTHHSAPDPASDAILWSGRPGWRLAIVQAGVASLVCSAAAIGMRALLESVGLPTAAPPIADAIVGMATAAVAASPLVRSLFGASAAAALRSLTTKFEVTATEIRVRTGFFSVATERIDVRHLKDVKLEEPFGLRLLSLGTLTLVTSDPTAGPTLLMPAVPQAARVFDLLDEVQGRARVAYLRSS